MSGDEWSSGFGSLTLHRANEGRRRYLPCPECGQRFWVAATAAGAAVCDAHQEPSPEPPAS